MRDCSFWIIYILPIEVHGQVSVVNEFDSLRLVLALVSRDELSDTCIDATKLDGVAVQVYLRCLHLTQKLEKERL